MAVVQQPVEDRGGDDRIAEHATPLGHRAVARDQHRAALVAATDELEEQVSGVGFERQVAQLVDHQQIGLVFLAAAITSCLPAPRARYGAQARGITPQ